MNLTCRASTFAGHEALWLTPDYFPINFDAEKNSLMLVPVSMDLYRRASFLDDREIPCEACISLPLDEAIQRMESAGVDVRPLHCIFHVAFCGSTLIARCLDELDGAMVLKEPYPLHALAEGKRLLANTPDAMEAWRAQFKLISSLLARTFHAAQVAIVKATDASTNLMADIHAQSAEARTLFLYVGLEDFLTSMLGDAMRSRFVRDRLAELGSTFPFEPLFRAEHWRPLNEAQRAVCLWWLHMRTYCSFVADHPHARTGALDFEAFLRDPENGLRSLARHFGVDAPDHAIRDALGETLKIHSKRADLAFGTSDRRARQHDTYRRYREEIGSALDWSERLFRDAPGFSLSALASSSLL